MTARAIIRVSRSNLCMITPPLATPARRHGEDAPNLSLGAIITLGHLTVSIRSTAQNSLSTHEDAPITPLGSLR